MSAATSSAAPLLPPQTSSSSNCENPTYTTTAATASLPSITTHDDPLYHESVQNADAFWKLLQEFHASLGTRIRVPKIGGKNLDLHLLFIEVTSRGGFEKVVSDRRWKEVIAAFNFPSTITSASFVIRKYYVSLLYQFEQAYYFGKQVRLPQISEAVQLDSPEPQQGSSVTGVIDGKFDDGYLVSVRIGGQVLKGVLYHIPQAAQISEAFNMSTGPATVVTKKTKRSSNDPSRSRKSRKSYSLSFSDDYARVQPVCHAQEEKVTSNNVASGHSKLTDVEKQASQEKGVQGNIAYDAEIVECKRTPDSNLQHS